LAINANDVKLYSITEKDVLLINDKHENPDYLPGITLSDRIEATLDMEYAVRDSDIIFLVVPSKSLVSCLNQLKGVYN
jgi:glycerol-3-phosphate dehydrogenase (NAD(P)+)